MKSVVGRSIFRSLKYLGSSFYPNSANPTSCIEFWNTFCLRVISIQIIANFNLEMSSEYISSIELPASHSINIASLDMGTGKDGREKIGEDLRVFEYFYMS